MSNVLIPPGPRVGRVLLSEAAFRDALARGDRVFTTLNKVFFEVTLGEGGEISYTALTERPAGL